MLAFIIGVFFFLVLLPFIGWYALIALGFCLFIGFLAWVAVPDCPRMILGYNCHGADCDHSKQTRDEAKLVMLRNKR